MKVIAIITAAVSLILLFNGWHFIGGLLAVSAACKWLSSK